MHKTILLFLFTFILCNSAAAQAKLPSAEALDFHKSRRNALRAKLPPNSVAVVFANPTRNRANDVDYVYHQDPNFFYLTGWREPHSILLLFSTPQVDEQGKYSELLYIQERDPRGRTMEWISVGD